MLMEDHMAPLTFVGLVACSPPKTITHEEVHCGLQCPGGGRTEGPGGPTFLYVFIRQRAGSIWMIAQSHLFELFPSGSENLLEEVEFCVTD